MSVPSSQAAKRPFHGTEVVGSAVAVALIGWVSIAVVGPPASATTSVTALGGTSFMTPSTPPGVWVEPAGPSGSDNKACLTAGPSDASSSIPNCDPTTDPSGSGALQLTTNSTNAVGAVFDSKSIPTGEGFDATFDVYQYNSAGAPGADGISFTMAAVDPTDPVAPSSTGPVGGSLGYSTQNGNSGLPHGYLGIGLDVYGNYLNSANQGSTCSTASPVVGFGQKVPQAVTVRGPGDGTTGYCEIASTGALSSGSLDSQSATTRPAAIPAEVAVNPSSGVAVTSSGLFVPASSVAVRVTPIGGTAQTITAALPSVAGNNAFPASWVNPSTGVPYQLAFGWTASTGSKVEYHDITTFGAQTLNGPVPTLGSTIADNAGGVFKAGTTDSYTISPSVTSAGGAEADQLTLRDTFPVGQVPQLPDVQGNGWDCSASTGQTLLCSFLPGSPLPPGTTLPTITVPVTVTTSAGAGPVEDSAILSSDDAVPTTASETVVTAQLPSAPISPVVTTPNSQTVLSWAPPNSDGGSAITGYEVTPYAHGVAGVAQFFAGATTSGLVTGLIPGTAYSFTVAAVNAVGVGVPSLLSASLVVPGNATDLNSRLIAVTPDNRGYWIASSSGNVLAFGTAAPLGDLAAQRLRSPIVGIAATPDGHGYWMVAADGGVFAFGDARFFGSAAALVLNASIVGLTATPDGQGYWLVAGDGGVFAFGDAGFFGSAESLRLVGPIVGMAATPDGHGYWLTGADGGVFSYGNAAFYGSMAGRRLNGPVVGIAATPGGGGYWLVADDGGIFTFGEARFYGSTGSEALNGPMDGIQATSDGLGYRTVARDGGVFSFGDAGFVGSAPQIIVPFNGYSQRVASRR